VTHTCARDSERWSRYGDEHSQPSRPGKDPQRAADTARGAGLSGDPNQKSTGYHRG
jgi:hypothetical protein